MLRLVRNDGVPPWSLADMLMAVHDRWLMQLRYLVGPALAPNTNAAERWTAVRHLQEEMGRWYGGERELTRSLEPLLSSEPVRRLVRAEEAISRLRSDLGRLEPQPEPAALVREMVLDLLDAFQLWCVELELAAAGLSLERLTDESRLILTRLSLTNDRRA